MNLAGRLYIEFPVGPLLVFGGTGSLDSAWKPSGRSCSARDDSVGEKPTKRRPEFAATLGEWRSWAKYGWWLRLAVCTASASAWPRRIYASVFINSSTLLWTGDKRLRRAAEGLGIHAGLA